MNLQEKTARFFMSECEGLKALLNESDGEVLDLHDFVIMDKSRYEQMEKLIKQYGKFLNNQRPPKNIDSDKVMRLKRTGLSNVKIAEMMNVSEGTIRNRLKNYEEKELMIKLI